jgi:hypothetical protein
MTMKRMLFALLTAAAMMSPALAQEGPRDTPHYDDERAYRGGRYVLDRGYDRDRGSYRRDRDFDRRRGAMNRNFDRRSSFDRDRRRGYASGRTYGQRYFGERSARNRSYGTSRY